MESKRERENTRLGLVPNLLYPVCRHLRSGRCIPPAPIRYAPTAVATNTSMQGTSRTATTVFRDKKCPVLRDIRYVVSKDRTKPSNGSAIVPAQSAGGLGKDRRGS